MSTETSTSEGGFRQLLKYDSLTRQQQIYFWRVVGLLTIFVMWEAFGRYFGSTFFAPISEVIPVYIDLLLEGTMLIELANSLRQMFIGYGIALVIGIPVGLMMGRVRRVEYMLDPWVSAFFVTATSAVLPVFIVIFGIDFTFRVAIVWLSAQWHIIIQIFQGAKNVNEEYIDVARSFDASLTQTYRQIVFPSLLPYVMIALRLGLGRAIKGMVLAELFVIVGYGRLLSDYARFSSTASLLAAILTIMLFAVISTQLLKRLGERVAPWYEA